MNIVGGCPGPVGVKPHLLNEIDVICHGADYGVITELNAEPGTMLCDGFSNTPLAPRSLLATGPGSVDRTATTAACSFPD